MHTGQQDTHGNWIRHPSNSVIPSYGEYQYAGVGAYDSLSPIAKQSVDETPDATIATGSDMVICLFCHRPHGSKYPDMLRWDFDSQLVGSGGSDTGCFYCHTSKN